MARAKGTNKEYRVAKKLVEQKLLLEEKVSDSILLAFQVLYDTMTDKDAGPSVRVGCAKTIIEMYEKFYKSRKGTSEITLDEFKAITTTSVADKKPTLLNLKFHG